MQPIFSNDKVMSQKINNTLNLLSKITFLRLSNLLKLYLSYFVSIITKKSFHKGMPFSVSIEPTTSCNLSCTQCPSGLKQFTRPTGKMSLNLYKKIIGQIHKKIFYILIYFQGEPFLNESFFDFVKHAKSKNIYTATSTNAHFLDLENAKRTIESGLDKIVISVDGVEQKTYEKYRKGGDLNKVLDGIENLVSQKKQLKSPTPYIIIQFIVFKHNEHEIDKIKAYWKKAGVNKVEIKTAQIYQVNENIDLIPTNKKFSRYIEQNDSFIIKGKLPNKCLRMWTSCVITWDGNVVPCCFDKDADYCFGDLKKEDFNLIWQNNGYKSFRSKILKSRKKIDICRNCTE